MIINFFILSAFSYVPEEKKITNYLAFRETLCAGLIAHAKPTADTANTAGTAGTTGTAGIAGQHQRVKIKRAPCVIYKQTTDEKRKGIKRLRKRILQEISPNIISKRSDHRISRAKTGCDICKVALCAKRGCWEAFYLGAKLEGPSA